MNTEVMFSSNDQTWETPLDLFNKLNYEFQFTLDVCALPLTAKCNNYYTPEINALEQDWNGNICWMNPEYNNAYIWMKKAYEESLKSYCIVVCLVPARTDTKWWDEFAMKASEIRFIKGRLKFGNSKNSAPFPSAIIIFDKYKRNNKGLIVSMYYKDLINPIYFIDKEDVSNNTKQFIDPIIIHLCK